MITYDEIKNEIAEIIYIEILKENKELIEQYAEDLNQEAYMAYLETMLKITNETKEAQKNIFLNEIRIKLAEYMNKFGYATIVPSGLIKPKDNIAVIYEDSIIDSIDESNKKRV